MLNGIMWGIALWVLCLVVILIGKTLNEHREHNDFSPYHVRVQWSTVTWLIIFMFIGSMIGTVYDKRTAKQAILKPVKMYVQKIT